MRKFSQFLILFAAGLTMAGAQTNFGSVNVGSSATSTVTVTVATAGTLGSIAVVTQGATGLDFTNVGTGTCATGTTYAVAATCTVAAKFKPLFAGTRYGAVVLKDGSGNVLATTPIYGIGTGPEVSFHPGAQTTLASGFRYPNGLAVDASGNVYVTQSFSSTGVREILAAGGYTTVNTLGSGFNAIVGGLAVDGSGNVFVADRGNNAVKEILAAGGYTTVNTLGSGFSDPLGVAVDGSGNVFVADHENSAVKEIPAAGGYTTVETLGSGINYPTGVAVDGSGNVFVAEYGNHAVKEILAAGGYTTVNTLGSGFINPLFVAVDGSGNVYVTDQNNIGVYEILAASGYTTVETLSSGFSYPGGVAVDGSGNVYVADYFRGLVVKLDFADAPALSFASTGENQTSADSPQTVQVQNVGNEALTFTSLSYPADFPEASGDSNACTASTSLSAGQQCDVPVDFMPLSVGALIEAVTIIDNPLNVSGAQQSIGVSGTGVLPTTASLSATSLSFGSQPIETTSATQQVTLTNTGSNTLYLSSIGVSGANASAFVFTNTCGTSLAAGASCSIQGQFAPTVTGAFTAAVTIADNVSGSPQNIVLSGTGIAPTATLSATSLPFGIQEVGTMSASQQVTLTNTGGQTLAITSIVVTGANASSFVFANTCGTSLAAGASCTIHGHLTPTGAGALTAAVTIADNASGSPQTVTLSGFGSAVVLNGSSASVNFGSQAIGSTSAAKTLSFSIASGTTVGSVGVLTLGAPNLDFTNASGSTCTAQSYATATNCTVNVTFAPRFAGLRSGAVVFYDGSGNLLGMAPIYGIGTGPQVTFHPGSESTLGGGFSYPFGVAVDGSGNVFVGDEGNNAVKEILAAGGYTTVNTLGSGFNAPLGVAVDGSGNVFVSDTYNNEVKEILAAGGYTTVNTLGSGFAHPGGVAVDGSGNVFVADYDNSAVKEILAAGGYTTVNTLGSGFSLPGGVAVDGSGNVFVADAGKYSGSFPGGVYEILAAGGYTAVNTLGSGFSHPTGVAVDGSGNVYVADAGNNVVSEMLAVGGSIPASPTINTLSSGFSLPASLAVDGSGNVYVADSRNFRIVKLDLADFPALSFASTTENQTSADSPQTVQVQNVGNEALTFTGLSYPTDFPEASGDSNACTGSSSLSAGQQCEVTVDFTPLNGGLLNENVVLTNNALNVSGAQQSIGVSGTAIGPTTVSLSATSLSFGSQPIGTKSAKQQVTLTNTGSNTLFPSSIRVTGANATSFDFRNNCGGSVAAGASCSIHGHFAPATTGTLSAMVTITDNASGSPQSIALSGTGIAPVATLSATSLSFGNVNVGEVSPSQEVTLTNTGTETLSIASIAVTGTNASMFGFSNRCGTRLAVGASCTIHGHFAPMTAGALSASVTITDNASDSPQSIALSGNGVVPAPAATLSTTSLSFGVIKVGTLSPSQLVTLTNTGLRTLTISSIVVTGPNASSFDFTNSCGHGLAVGKSCNIHGHFAPATTGTFNATVTITDNASDSPQSIALSGTGRGPVATLSATSLSFGDVNVGSLSPSQQATLTNTGLRTLTISNLVLTGPNASSFDFTNSCGDRLAVGASCTIHGHFAPTTAGALSASVTITDNASDSPQSIALSGTGAAAAATLSATSLSFGNVRVGIVSPSQEVTLTNSGLRTLTISSIVVTGPNASSFDFTNNCGHSVAAGASCSMHGHFAPTTTGALSATIALTDNAGDSPQSIALSGTGREPIATLSATSLTYGAQLVGTTSASQQVTLTNTGNMPLAIRSTAVTGTYASSFGFTNLCTNDLAVGESCIIHGHFQPTTAGALSAAVTITDDAGDSPQTIALNGTGLGPIATLSATSLSFGSVNVGAVSPSQQVTLTNTGSKTLTISSIAVTGPDASSFGFSNRCGHGLAVGASCTIHGHFAPTTAGALNAAITITDNVSDSPQSIALSGNGVVPAPAATLSTTSLSFGVIKVGTLSPSQQATLTNTGLRTLTISSIVVTGPNASSFDFTNSCGHGLAVGKSCNIHGHFAPATAGTFNAAVTITDNASDSPQSIALSGTGRGPVATLSAASLSFGNVRVGIVSPSQQVTLTNTGLRTLVISSIVVTGPNASSFDFTDKCGTSLAVGASCVIHGHFQPTTAGALSAAVSITDNADDSPQSIALSGNGVVPGPAATLSATSVSFVGVKVGLVSRSQQVTLTNTGLRTLVISGIVVTGPNASSFDFASNCGHRLAVGASCIIHGHFQPTTAGALSAAVTIADNASDSPQSISLSGTGLGPIATLSATSLSFGNVNVGAVSPSQQVTLTNTGLKTLIIASIVVTGKDASSFDFANNFNSGHYLAPGASCIIHGHFAPTATGPLNAAITITDNAGDSPQSVMLAGTGQ